LVALDASVAVENSLRGTFLKTLAKVKNVESFTIRAQSTNQENILVGKVLPEIVNINIVDRGEIPSIKGYLIGIGIDNKTTQSINSAPKLTNKHLRGVGG
jgi:hypothetical protein